MEAPGLKTIRQWRQELGGKFLTLRPGPCTSVKFHVHPDHTWITAPWISEHPLPNGEYIKSRACFLKLISDDTEPLWLQICFNAMRAVEGALAFADLKEPGLEFTLTSSGEGRFRQFFVTHRVHLPEPVPFVEMKLLEPAKSGCQCPTMDLLSTGHRPGCPEKRR